MRIILELHLTLEVVALFVFVVLNRHT
jgi:hypothetical protein